MSYRSVVLSDGPVAYYPLDDLTTVDQVGNYTAFLSQFSSYQDVLNNLSSYANIFGDIAFDHSGYENDGFYAGDPEPEILPVNYGNRRATKVTNTNSVAYTLTNNYTGTTP